MSMSISGSNAPGVGELVGSRVGSVVGSRIGSRVGSTVGSASVRRWEWPSDTVLGLLSMVGSVVGSRVGTMIGSAVGIETLVFRRSEHGLVCFSFVAVACRIKGLRMVMDRASDTLEQG